MSSNYSYFLREKEGLSHSSVVYFVKVSFSKYELDYNFDKYNSRDDLVKENIKEISNIFVETKKRSDQKQQEQEYNKKKKKIFYNAVDYNDQLIVCENCLRPIIVLDITTAIPRPKYCKTCLKYAML
jgi:hypothetical protein